MKTVAIVGAGPGGLAAARYIKQVGFTPVLFEQGGEVGGQWSADARFSGVWPSMRTNTSRVLTSFSDLQYDPHIAVYPTNQEVGAYLRRYAEHFDLLSHLRLKTRVDEIARDCDQRGWVIRFTGEDGTPRSETFANVIVATGRYNVPSAADIAGLDSFTGAGGVSHTFAYKKPERYRGQRVLVCGGAISALEIASDLAMLGAARVISTVRRQRYVLQKLLAGIPADHLAFTRFAALAEESFPVEVIAQSFKEFVTRTSGSPEQFGAPRPADHIAEAGITMSQHFLPLVAEGRIIPRPWIAAVEGQRVRFVDGSEEEVDAIIFGTGYALHLPFLSEEIRRTLDLDTQYMDLDRFTFHPDLEGLAFLGLFQQVGPYFPVFELQARWIAYVWSGVRPAPARSEMEANIAAHRKYRGLPQMTSLHAMALVFARAAGVEPELRQWPELVRELLFGPLTPISFRLSGPDSLPEAARRVVEEARIFGAVPTSALTPEQKAQLQALAAARGEPSFARFVEQVILPAQGRAE